jgi:hypothetical protein
MIRKLLIAGIALVGFTLAVGSNAWAGQDKGGNRYQKKGEYHQTVKTPPGHHNGWEKDRQDPCQPDHRFYPPYPPRHQQSRPVVEKHVHHYDYSEDRRDDDHFSFAVSLIDNVIGIAVAVSGAH